MTEIISRLGQKLSKIMKGLPTRLFKRFEIMCADKKLQVINEKKEEAMETHEKKVTIDCVKIVF
jgi:hypothetical protein